MGGRPTHKGVSIDRIVDAAVQVLADHGYEGLTTAEVARRLDISQPTLYSHVRNLDQLRSLIAVRGMRELSHRVRVAVQGREGDDAMRAMAYAYRGFVRNYPALYMIQQRAPSTQEYWDAAPKAAQAVQDVLRGYGIDDEQLPHVHLVFRTSIHGFVDQEINNAIPDVQNIDASFDLFLRFLTDGIKMLAADT
ncbi:TetR/AcrR family transcriptional regulator [Prauserella muralis]|uniref:Uncharacterized protein n=1 Tax=Prauserella muralis TaxID=588067 RepID=A0A2V4ATW2_9PSEU|nr:TetR/AcrR family transcriptional regulator [Prauserella muralis]PXY24693.1 hypothetical protein BAY60_19505 [Prauserella muralis]TWE27614.1 TetR family transcriptional regulator [Prauserella muralis]